MLVIHIVWVLTVLAYTALVFYLFSGLKKLAFKVSVRADAALPAFTLLVPFYNDAAGIAQLLPTLEQNLVHRASPYQIIFIDDYSASGQATEVKTLLAQTKLTVSYVKNNLLPGKKNALSCGVRQAKHTLIIQTDADCQLQPHFFNHILAPFTQPTVQVVLGLVKMTASSNFWSRFAVLDFLSLQASGLALAAKGQAIMGNGAALAYRKEVWHNHHKKGANWPSGDDVFLIQAQAKVNAQSVVAAPAANAFSAAPQTFWQLLSQRLRWGAKTSAYPSLWAKGIAGIVALSNLALALMALMAFFGGALWPIALALWIIKLFADYSLLKNFAQSTQQTKALKGYWLMGIVYPFYLSTVVVAILFYGRNISWKGRSTAPELE